GRKSTEREPCENNAFATAVERCECRGCTMNQRLSMLLLGIASMMAVAPAAHAQIEIDALIVTGTDSVSAVCSAAMEDSGYDGVAASCTLTLPGGSTKSCTANESSSTN